MRWINAISCLWSTRRLLTGNPQITFFKKSTEDTLILQLNK